MSIVSTIPLSKKYKSIPNGSWIEYYSMDSIISFNPHVRTTIDYRDHYSATGKILSRVSTNGKWEKRGYDEQDRIVYYENSNGLKKRFEYHIDEFGVEQKISFKL